MSSSVTPKLKINTPVAAKLGVNLRHKLIIGLSLLVMTVLPVILSRMLFIDLSLRLDEAQSLFQTSHSLPRMLQLVAQDVHVPLYHLLLRGWQLAFGSGVEAIRYLSLVLFMAIIPLVYVLARHIFGWKQSLLAAGLVAISPFMNWYGNEARMYTLLALMTLINQIFFLRIIQRKTGAWWGYLFSAIVGIYSHYFFGFVLLTQAVFYLFRRKDFARGALLRFIGVALAVIAAISPWAYYVYSLGSASRTRPMLIHPTSVDLFNTFSQFLFGFQDDRINTLLVSLWPLVVLIGFLGVQRKRQFTPEITYLAMAAFLPILGAYFISIFVSPLYISRYLIVALPALYLLMLWIIGNLPRRLPLSIGVILVAAMSLTLTQQAISQSTPVKENYAGVSEYLERSVSPQDVVVLSAPFTIYPMEYYYGGSAPLETLPQWNRFESGDAPAYQSSQLASGVKSIGANHKFAWVVLSYDQGNNEEIRRYYDSNYERISQREFSPGLTVYQYRLRYDIPDTEKLIESLNK